MTKRALFAAALTTAVVVFAAEIATVEPATVAAQLTAKDTKPLVLYAGPSVLFRSKHIPGAIFAGPGNKSEGLDLLKTAVKDVPKSREIVIYCGCCPWDRCPNIRPAFELLSGMGFQHVRAMYAPTGFKADWIDKGYPAEP